MPSLVGIAYCSQPVNFSFEAVDDILSVSQRNNLGAALTGALIYDNKTFLQWIEGGPSEIRALFERISNDPRHSRIKLLSVRKLENRLFPDWTMTAAVTQDQTLRGLTLVPHLSLADFNPANWSEADVSSFMDALSDYLTRRPAPRSVSVMRPVAPRRPPVNALNHLDQSLVKLGQQSIN